MRLARIFGASTCNLRRNNLGSEDFRFVQANEIEYPVLWIFNLLICIMDSNSPIVIAHRGASGYAAEHTDAAKALAHAGCDLV